MSARILVVEDEYKVAEALREGLEGEDYEVAVAGTCAVASRLLADGAVDVVLLDLTLPDGDGLDLLKAVRERGKDVSVLALTARDGLDDRVLGLDCGADAYLTKPFAFSEVLAYTRALLRRGRAVEPNRLAIADLEMDVATRTVVRAGQPVELTRCEFQLLKCLLEHEAEVVSRETLARDVWPDTVRSETLDNVMDVHVARLRRKIDAGHAVKLICTVRGVGFVLREQSS